MKTVNVVRIAGKKRSVILTLNYTPAAIQEAIQYALVCRDTNAAVHYIVEVN